MISFKITIVMMTESMILFDVLTKATCVTEKRLMIHVCIVKGAYEKMKFKNVAFIRSEFNPADAFTKVEQNSVLEKN